MSWIFGYYGNRDRLQISSPETQLHTFQNSNLILYVGGNSETIFFKSDSLNSNCWAVAGVGIIQSGDEYKILNVSGWENFLNSRQVDLQKINGHFVAVKYSDDELKFFTDELGLREIYIVKLPEGIGFTTRIDWLKYFINPELDLREFGSRWLLQNQISKNSIIKNVKRLVCANAALKNGNLTINENPWQPDLHVTGNREMFDITLRKLLSNDGKKISLSLSGGLDSRLLLSYLLNKDSDLWETHTFGDTNHPDSKVASDLLKAFNYQNKTLDEFLPARDKLIQLVKSYCTQSAVTNRITSILNLRFYERFIEQNNIIVDGGFGEIWRREFANKLLLLGKNALQQKDSSKIFSFLEHNKADIFSEDALIEMERGSIEQIENFIEEMPDVINIGIGNWVDLFSIRARLPNYYAPEQARVDQYIVSFMPLIQKDILKLLFCFDDADKRNGRLIKSLIRQNAFQLTKHPLVKGSVIHPFNSSSISARLHSRIKFRLRLNFQSNQPIELFNSLNEFINDLMRSAEVKNCDLYDQSKVKRIAEDFSTGRTVYNFEMDWFLSFELFRQGISK